MDTWDAVVVGAGPAGLTAATYLARFRRRVLVLGDGLPRARWIPQSHNTPGFPGGVGGPELLDLHRRQALEYGAQIRTGEVNSLARAGDGFEISGACGSVTAQTVLLATGVVDRLPDLEGLDAAIRRGVVRMCPICDAYEAIGKRIAVLGEGPLAEHEALFLRTYSDDVTVIGGDIAAVSFGETGIEAAMPDGARRAFDCLYLALGAEPQSQLARGLGAAIDDDGNLVVDSHQMTSISGLFAAGDVVRGLNQIAVATGEAAIAATAIHNRLRAAASK